MNGEITRGEDQPLDLSVELEVDRWNGAEQPRVVVRELYPLSDAPDAELPAGACGTDCPPPDSVWWARFGAETGSIAEGRPGPLLDVRAPEGPRRELVDRRGGAAVACLAELVSSGESVLAICADAAPGRPRRLRGRPETLRRRAAPARLRSLRRPGSGRALGLIRPPARGGRSDPRRLERDCAPAPSPSPLPARRPDRSPSERSRGEPRTQGRASGEGFAAASAAGGYLHVAFGPTEVEFSERLLARDWELRGAIGEIWRELAAAGGEAEGAACARCSRAARGMSERPRSPPGACTPSTSLAFVSGGQMPPPGPYGFILGEDRSGAIAGLRGLPRQAPGGHPIPAKQSTGLTSDKPEALREGLDRRDPDRRGTPESASRSASTGRRALMRSRASSRPSSAPCSAICSRSSRSTPPMRRSRSTAGRSSGPSPSAARATRARSGSPARTSSPSPRGGADLRGSTPRHGDALRRACFTTPSRTRRPASIRSARASATRSPSSSTASPSSPRSPSRADERQAENCRR